FTLSKERMKRSYHEFCAVDDPYLHCHRMADGEPPAGVDAPLTATQVVWITPPSIAFRRGNVVLGLVPGLAPPLSAFSHTPHG
ncbi:hypothetical protein ACPV6C_29925, partial [Klebsiella pneumoniae]|uniref:hypothetical protein n=1 Tax=Klebsiella pneumoniae TaxID=573 RepID=UPI003CAADC1E